MSPPPEPPRLLVSSRAGRVRRGGAVRLKRGVYAVAPDDWARAAAALAGLHDSALGRQSAAWLLTGGRVSLPAPVDVVTPPGSQSRAPGAHEEPLCDGEVCEVAGLRVTAPLRTALDIARFLPRRRALPCQDALTNTGCVRLAEIAAAVAALRRVRGVVIARSLVGEIEPRAESVRETWLRLAIVDGGLPRPQAQLRVLGEGGAFLGWADLGYARLRLLVEYLGQAAHARALDADAARGRLLAEEGYAVVPFTNADLRNALAVPALVEGAARRQYDALGLRGPLWVPEPGAAGELAPALATRTARAATPTGSGADPSPVTAGPRRAARLAARPPPRLTLWRPTPAEADVVAPDPRRG